MPMQIVQKIYWSYWFHLSCSSASILPSFLIPVFCIFLRDGFKMLMQILINFLYSICFLYDCNVDLLYLYIFFSLALISHIL